MSSAQPHDADVSHKVATLRELVEHPSSRSRLAPLVTLLMARNVDIHGKMLTDLSNRMQQMKEGLNNDSKHTSRVLERMQRIEQDAKALQQLVQVGVQRDMEAKTNEDQLRAALNEAMEQNTIQMASIGQRLKAVEEQIERQQHSDNGTKAALDTAGQCMKSLQCDIDKLRQGFEKIPPHSPVEQRVAELEERITTYFDQSSKNVEDINLSLASIETQMGSPNTLSGSQTVDNAVGQPTSGISSADAGKRTAKQPELQDWPVILEFLAIYEQHKELYKSKKPKSELEFIEAFLQKLNVHVSCALQRHLLEMYPNKVDLVALKAGERPPEMFITMGRMRWKHIKSAISRYKDLRRLQWASNMGISGPGENC